MDQRKIAESVLEQALHQIKTKGQTHGDASASFKMIGQMWDVYIQHVIASRPDTNILPHDVAHMMSMVKIARSLYGYHFDNYVDEAGYAALACMLNPTTTNTKAE